MAQQARRAHSRRSSPSARRAAGVERVERRLMLSVTQTQISPSETFTWDTATQGRDVLDSPLKLRSLLDAPIVAASGGGAIYLDLDGVDGEVTAKNHAGEIGGVEFEFAADRDHAGTDAGGPNFTDLHFVTRASRAHTQLLNRLQGHSVIPMGRLLYTRPTAGGTGLATTTVTLKNIRVDGVRSTTGVNGVSNDEFNFSFTAATIAVDLGSGTPYTFSWDVPDNGGSVADFALPERSLIEAPAFTSAADQMFLRLDDISGTATQKGHEDEIQIEGFAWSMNATPGGVDFGEVHFAARVARQTPLLIDRVANGEVIDDADFFGTSFAISGAADMTSTIDFDNVVISSHRLSSLPSGAVIEEFTLSFTAYSLLQTSASWGSLTNDYNLATEPATIWNPPLREREALFETRGATDGGQTMFLEVDGIDGEATQKGFSKFIAVADFEWGVDRSVLGAPRFNHLHIVAPTSIATPLLMERQAQGTTISTVTLHIVTGTGTVQRIALSGVKVDALRTNSLHAGVNTDEYQFSFKTETFADLRSGISAGVDLGVSGGEVNGYAYATRSLLDATPPGDAYSNSVAYLRLDGIEGGVTQKTFEGSLDVLSFEWGAFIKGGIRYDELRVVTVVDKSAPALMDAVAKDAAVALGSLDAYRAGVGGGLFRSYGLQFQVAHIGSYQVSATADNAGQFTQEIALRFESFTLNAQGTTNASKYSSPVGIPFVAVQAAPSESILERGSALGAAVPSMFLQLDGIPGGSTQKGQEQKFEVVDFEWAIDHAGSVHYTELHFVVRNGRGAPTISSRLATNAPISAGQLVVGVPNVGGGGVVTYSYVLDFVTANVSSIRSTNRADGTNVDEITLRFVKPTLKYLGAPAPFTYSVTGESMIYDVPPPDQPLTRAGPVVAGVAPVYLFLDGINGGSTQKGKEGAFEVRAFEWRRDRSFISSPGGPDFGELRFVVPVNRGTPSLLDRLANGTLIPSGTVQFTSVGGGGGTITTYQTLAFTSALVSSQSITTTLDGEVVEEFTIAFDQPVDVFPPRLVSASFEYEARQALTFAFSESVAASLTTSDLSLRNLTTSQTISLAGFTLSASGAFTYTLTPPPGVILPNGEYRATVTAAGVSDASGNLLSAASAIPLDFFVLAGDADRNRRVDFDDLLTLARNYGQSGKVFSGANFDYSADGSVNFDDLLVLAKNYNATLPATAAAAQTGAATRRRTFSNASVIV